MKNTNVKPFVVPSSRNTKKFRDSLGGNHKGYDFKKNI